MWLADAKSQFRPQAQWASNVTVSVTDPMCYPNDEPRPRKSRVAIALWLLTLIGVIAWASGCQVRISQTWPDGSKTEYLNSRTKQEFRSIEFRKGDTTVIVKGAKGDSEVVAEAVKEVAALGKAGIEAAK
jgi:hypothetical protein